MTASSDSLYVCTCSFRYGPVLAFHCAKAAERSHLQGIIDTIDVLSSTAKEEEKQKLLKWSSDLKQEREQLEQKVKQLSNSITVSIAVLNDGLFILCVPLEATAVNLRK